MFTRPDVSVGVDVGTLYLKLVSLEHGGRAPRQWCIRHQGRPLAAFRKVAQDLCRVDGLGVGVTGAGGERLAELLGVPPVDLCRATIEGVRAVVPRVRNILDIGGGSLTLIGLDAEGHLRDYSTNSLCAAGTGSFLDAQAERLGMDEADQAKLGHVDDPPPIATRCAVFAKSDLIHKQQEGYGKAALWCGLCRGLSGTILQTLLHGRPLEGLTVVTGGVARNGEVLRWLQSLQETEIRTYEGAEYAAAEGAARLAREPRYVPGIALLDVPDHEVVSRNEAVRLPLRLERTAYPSFEVSRSWEDSQDNEIRITRWPNGRMVRGFVGIDVGSTSTKLVLVDEAGEVLLDIYRKTGGDPIDATKRLFRALDAVALNRGATLDLAGCGTTGSGRKMIGILVGADAVINEISAHVRGALATDPTVDTIFEIGGQDSKYIHVRDGFINEANMNYVCAAGTGSFVEEQAIKLGHRVDEVGELVMEVAPPHTSDRCTVFMEQDVELLLRKGYAPREALAAVMYSVVQNYLSKVVGNRPRSREKIFFCGATARNQGLVAAFEQLLGVEIVVSPYCHVLGAYGVALEARERVANGERPSSFKGLDLSSREVRIEREICDICSNDCTITYAHVDGEDEVASWGYLCGRDPDEMEKREPDEFEAFRQQQRLTNRAVALHRYRGDLDERTVGLPQTLATYSHRALWMTFLSHLGFPVRLSTPTNEEIREKSSALVGAEFCFPVKLAHGHVASLLEDDGVSSVFLPHLVSERVPEEHTNAFYCPLVAGIPAITGSAARLNRLATDGRILSPIVDFRWDEKRQAKELAEALAEPLERSTREIRAAWKEAVAAQQEYDASRREEGRRILEELRALDKPVVLCMGRPYNLYDAGSNLELPLKIAEAGFPVLPVELAPLDDVVLGPEFRNVFWTYGQQVIRALVWVRDQPDVFPVWFTNFKCGPDSILLSYGEQILGDKPSLILELDEHGADAGYMTRIEAFLDVIRTPRAAPGPRVPFPNREDPVETVRSRRMWVPDMHPIGTPAVAAAMRGHGYDAHALPPSSEESLAIGRRVTRGGECVPIVVITGRFLQLLEELESDGSAEALFLPAGCGPCRFGQYTSLLRLALEREGYSDVAILSPNNDNAYQGLEEALRRKIWLSILLSDILFKLGCRFRPYEAEAGLVDGLVDAGVQRLCRAFESGGDLEEAMEDAVAPFRALPPPGHRPLVGIVGEVFLRLHPFSNQFVVRAIEEAGGEAWLAPLHEWVLYSCHEHERRGEEGWDLLGQAKAYIKNRYLFETERRWYERAGAVLASRHEPPIADLVEAARPYAAFNFGGEVVVTIGRAIHFFRQGAAMVVNCSPFGCMPGTTISALFNEIQRGEGRPVVNLYYDGTGDLNELVQVFLRNLGAEAPVVRKDETRTIETPAANAEVGTPPEPPPLAESGGWTG